MTETPYMAQRREMMRLRDKQEIVIGVDLAHEDQTPLTKKKPKKKAKKTSG